MGINCGAEENDKEEVLMKGEKIGRLWRVKMNKDLTMKERRRRWRIIETARRERARRKRIEVSNRELRVKSRR